MPTRATDTDGFCTGTHPKGCVDRRPGRYLVAIYWLQNGSDRRVRTGEITEDLGVHPASVTEMLGKLGDASLVEYEKYRGTTLARRGDTVARELAWRQCTVRVFFRTHLDLELDAHTAYRIGYTLPTRGIERLTELVGHRHPAPCCGASATESACLFGGQSS